MIPCLASDHVNALPKPFYSLIVSGRDRVEDEATAPSKLQERH
jgi:hypothetical protein